MDDKTTEAVRAALNGTAIIEKAFGQTLRAGETNIGRAGTRQTGDVLTWRGAEPTPVKGCANPINLTLRWQPCSDHNASKIPRYNDKLEAALAESGYKKLRLVWNSNLPRRTKLRSFQSTFIPILIYGLDTLTLTDKHINRIDAFYLKFLRRIVNIKASYYSKFSNHVVWRTVGYPKKPSYFLLNSQYSILSEVFHTDSSKPLHHVVFNSAYRDRIIVKGRRRFRKKPYFIETAAKRYFSKTWSENPGRGIFGPHVVYSAINRHLKRTSGHAPKLARRRRAQH